MQQQAFDFVFRPKQLDHLSQRIHELAVACAKEFLSAEAQLLDAIMQVDRDETYKCFNTHLTPYCVAQLGLSEEVAGEFVRVARKSVEIPQLREAVHDGLSVSKAKRVVSVITPENAEHWLTRAKSAPRAEIEREVVKESPRPVLKERAKPVGENRNLFRFELDDRTASQQQRAQELVSQKLGRPASLAEAQEYLLDCFLKHHDPIQKAERSMKRSAKRAAKRASKAAPAMPDPKDADTAASSGEAPPVQANPNPSQRARARSPIPAAVAHAVNLRDRRCCQARLQDGSKCGASRWVHLHHIREVAKGGENTVENLITLCSTHHRLWHEQE